MIIRRCLIATQMPYQLIESMQRQISHAFDHSITTREKVIKKRMLLF